MGKEEQEKSGDFNRQIWAKTCQAVQDQSAFNRLLYFSWNDEAGGLLLPEPQALSSDLRRLRREWRKFVKPTTDYHFLTVGGVYRFPENLRFNSGPGGLLASLDFLPARVKKKSLNRKKALMLGF